MKRIKSFFITLGLASGMTAAALFYFHNATQCRAMVLRDLKANAKFAESVSAYAQPVDFLTAMGRK